MQLSDKAKADWDRMCEHSKLLKEANDCTVKAITAVTGVHYVDVHALLAKHGRPHRRGAQKHTQYRTLKDLGFVYRNVKLKDCKTVRTLGRRFRGVKGTFLAWTRGHVLAIVDGEVLDWTNGRLHRIINIVEVVSKYDERAKEGDWK